MSDRKEEGSFLNRWSLRKQQSAGRGSNADAAPEIMTESDLPEPADTTTLTSGERLQGEFSGSDLKPTDDPADDTATSVAGTGQRSKGVVPVEPATALLTDADMPDIESLTSSSDISGFLGKGVSAALRKAALRHVFRQPEYNRRDGLDDYDDDYTTFEPLGGTVTSDMKYHAAREERARLAKKRLAEEPVQAELDTPVRADTAQDDRSTVTSEQAQKTGEEPSDASQEGSPDANQVRHENAVATVQGDALQHTKPAQASVPDQCPGTDKPLNKTSQATASQPNEIPDE